MLFHTPSICRGVNIYKVTPKELVFDGFEKAVSKPISAMMSIGLEVGIWAISKISLIT